MLIYLLLGLCKDYLLYNDFISVVRIPAYIYFKDYICCKDYVRIIYLL